MHWGAVMVRNEGEQTLLQQPETANVKLAD